MRLDNDLHDSDPQEREISLGTATIIGIFLALALICAAFFGFGYSLGRHSSPSAAATAPQAKTDKPDKADSPFSDFKPPIKSSTADDDSASASPADDSSSDSATANKPTERVAVRQETAKPPAHPVSFPSQPTAPPTTASPSTANGPQAIVQVSATSRQGDAEALIAALKRKGYNAAIRQVPQDKLFHVQLGPYANKKDAEVMRKRLDTDGYKAIVK